MKRPCYKATRPDGTDFHTGTVNYAAARESGEVIRHPTSNKIVPSDAGTYLSVSTEPADCTGFSWPCRLFRVEPVGRARRTGPTLPNKRAVLGLRVVEELPAWQALGPQGNAVAKVIEVTRAATADQLNSMAAAWDAARAAAWDAAWDAAWAAAWAAARDAAWDAARDAAWDAARDAAWTYLVRDKITEEQFRILAGPWISVFGEVRP